MCFLKKSLPLQHKIIKNSNIMQRFTKAIAAIMLMTAVFCAAGCTKPDEPNNGGNDNEGNEGNSLNGHEYVDLGLPSGTLWATCNVGAYGVPEGYGNFFAWSNTAVMGDFNWSAHWYSNSNTSELTKYCSNSYYGFNGYVDTLSVLLPNDDAATAQWGEGWRTPTKVEWEELFRGTTHTWTKLNEVNGRLFTASNGNSIFLPAAGLYCEGTEWFCEGNIHYNPKVEGHYWSSSLNTGDPISAWVFAFDLDDYGMGNLDRYIGCSIRAVCTQR